jgi:rod shape-determining protein MreD
MKVLTLAVAVGLALLFQTTVIGFIFSQTPDIDLVLIVVVYVALKTGPVSGLLAGSFAGLSQDLLVSSVLGVNGLAKSLVGFIIAGIGQRIMMEGTLFRASMFMTATAVNTLIIVVLGMLFGIQMFPLSFQIVLSQMITNTILGVVAVMIGEGVIKFFQQRRFSRYRRL